MVRDSEENESGGGEQRGGKGKTNILSPPGTQLAAQGCCLYIRTVDRTVAVNKITQNNTLFSVHKGG